MLALLTASTGAYGQSPEITRTAKDGLTLVRMEPLKISGEKDEYYSLQLALSFRSEGAKVPETIDFEIQTVVKKHKLNPDLYVVFLIESEEVFLSSNRWAVKNPVPGKRLIGERIVMRMPIETYRKLAKAKSSVIKLGKTSFAIGDEQKAAMLKLLQLES
jgi:hypothetical protein